MFGSSKPKPSSSKPFSGKQGVNDAKVLNKEAIKPKTGFTEFPTAKLTAIKTVDPFA